MLDEPEKKMTILRSHQTRDVGPIIALLTLGCELRQQFTPLGE